MLVAAQVGPESHPDIVAWLMESSWTRYTNIDWMAENDDNVGLVTREITLDEELQDLSSRFNLAQDVVACAHEPNERTMRGLSLIFQGQMCEFDLYDFE
jgi:hypothetical protein